MFYIINNFGLIKFVIYKYARILDEYMTVIGIDDTDSRTEGMCTTYVGHKIATRLEENGFTVEDILLIRLNPSAKFKTRGNAAVAIHTDADKNTAYKIAKEYINSLSIKTDEHTNPALVVCGNDIPEEINSFTYKCITELCSIVEAEELINKYNLQSYYLGNGRGRIGSIAAIGAKQALDDWTFECISYRVEEQRGTDRKLDYDSLFDEAEKYYPKTWDTVDLVQNSAVCVPNAPGPILYGIRGDDRKSVIELSKSIIAEETIESRRTFRTNQGTDIHIQPVNSISEITNNSAYRITGSVTSEPVTKEGGHVFFEVEDDSDKIDAVAFEPTKHFRNIIRKLRIGDDITIHGEVTDNTIKIEKIRINKLNTIKYVNPTCEDCNISMSSAGKNQGYRCRKCKNVEEKKERITVERVLKEGWYEVSPCARRHISKPLIRDNKESYTYRELDKEIYSSIH